MRTQDLLVVPLYRQAKVGSEWSYLDNYGTCSLDLRFGGIRSVMRSANRSKGRYWGVLRSSIPTDFPPEFIYNPRVQQKPHGESLRRRPSLASSPPTAVQVDPNTFRLPSLLQLVSDDSFCGSLVPKRESLQSRSITLGSRLLSRDTCPWLGYFCFLVAFGWSIPISQKGASAGKKRSVWDISVWEGKG
ncbi:hypothetical protein BDW66DRAFT_142224 [Aspergillus desertorum]